LVFLFLANCSHICIHRRKKRIRKTKELDTNCDRMFLFYIRDTFQNMQSISGVKGVRPP
jgi:hypothetical protein